MHNTEIRYFMAVATTGSISAASQQLFVAISAISRHIQRLETRLGVTLFERSPRGMQLNDAGHILANHVRRSMADMELAVAELQGIKAVAQTTIRVVCTDGLAFNLLPNLMAKFRRLHPRVSFILTVGTGRQVPELVRNGECDLAIRFILSPESGVEVLASFPSPVLIFMKDDHPLAERDIQLADLNAWPVVLPDQSATIRQLFDLSCRMNNVFIDPVFTCNHFSTLYEFVCQTPGAISVSSHYSIMTRARQDGLIIKTINRDQLSQRSLQLQSEMGKPRSAMLDAFFVFLREELQQRDQQCRKEFDLQFR
ncbi:Transcriptional regulator, LysR family [Pantoea sp. AS-PWVM4]|uniref:LysR family transcriptional regulator n=1 Tax=Pantoea sp. AS-PWVM4 TaxID=1332069 RepID=UPI0003AC6BC8|nr:LysR family transcriptional regulator [Pantoea sp. AS-PWVM4]ERK16367.1 Transcriptional regulator, LysR family [Pantoea sp. AS-PWVM4]